MSPLPTLDAAWTAWLAGLLLHSCWLAAAAGALAWLGIHGTSNPRIRHAIALGSLGLIAVGMLVAGIATWPEMRAVLPLSKAGVLPGTWQAAAAAPATAPASVATVAEAVWDWRPWLVLAWSLGVLLIAVRHGLGYVRILALRRAALPADPHLLARVAALCRDLGLAIPRVLLCQRILVPAAMGWWRPALLLPASLLTSLPPAQVEALILHELAHLRRRDALVEAGLSALECLLFFHPALWWLGRQLREAREQCCDQDALRAGAAPECLASALLALAEGVVAPAPALAATGGALAGRVRRILGAPERRRGRIRGLVAVLVLPLVLALVAACAARQEAEPRPLGLTPGMVTGPDRGFDLARRIRAHADGRQVTTSLHLISGDAAFWAGAGLSGDDQQVLSAEAVARILHAAEAANTVVQQPTLTTYPLQRAHAAFLRQYSYIADYAQQVDGRPEPIIKVLSYGQTVELCVEPGSDGGAVVASVGYRSAELLGVPIAHCGWEAADGRVSSDPVEEPVLLAGEARLQQPDVALAGGQALALPVQHYVQRETAACRTWAKTVEEGTPVVVPHIASLPRQMLIVQARCVTAPDRQDGPARLAIEPGAVWIDACRVSLDARDESLPAVLDRLAAQLPVPTRLERDPDNAATRISISAKGEPLADVLARLLPQTLLDATAGPTFLRLNGAGIIDFPAPAIGVPQGAQSPAGAAQQALPVDILPWPPAGESAVLAFYDVSDLLARGAEQTMRTADWEIAIDPPPQPAAFADGVSLVRNLKTLIPASAWGEGRDITLRNGGSLVVQAAPGVQSLVVATLDQARQTSAAQVAVQVDLVRLDAAAGKALGDIEDGQRLLSADSAVVSAMLSQASQADQAGILAGQELTLWNGTKAGMRTNGDGWAKDLSLSMRPILSADRRYITIALEVGSGQQRMSSTVTLADGGSILLASGRPDVGVILRARAVFFEEVETGL